MSLLELREIVEAGLCIGCGLCASIGDGVTMRMTEAGVERPTDTSLPDEQLSLINAVCPGLLVQLETEVPADPVWGPSLSITRGHAADEEVRFQAATGGVLTALGQFLVESGRVSFVLHVKPDPAKPLLWSASLSRDAGSVSEGSGSRYGPVAPLSTLMQALDLGERFAVVAKPCDAAAVRNLAKHDARVDDLVQAILVLACGGASKMTKTWGVLEDFGVDHADVESIRYRGYGNPGPTTVRTKSGEHYSTTYLALWEDEGTWDLQWRCKICPDGMGEVADLVSLDCWPGGAPTGEDAGFNGIIARTPRGQEVLDAAVEAGSIVIIDDDLEMGVLDSWQPHQARRKKAALPRLEAMVEAGLPVLSAPGLQLEQAAKRLTPQEWRAEIEGAAGRIAQGVNRDATPAESGESEHALNQDS